MCYVYNFFILKIMETSGNETKCQESYISNQDTLTNLNPLSANPTKWSNTLKQFVGICRRIV